MIIAAETWYLTTAASGRRRLFPRGIVALFALSLVLVGWLALPNKQLQERLANAHETDLLTVAYLNAWLNATPKDMRLRLTLARHQTLIGHNKEALKSIETILAYGPGSYTDSALRLRLNILERMAFDLPENHPRRASLLARVRYELERLALTATDPIEIEAYLRRATALDHPSLIAKLLTRLPEALARQMIAGGSTRDEAFARYAGRPVQELARKAIGLGDFRLAAQLYWQAFDNSRDPARRLELLILVSKAEQAGNRLAEFFVAYEKRMHLVTLDDRAYKRFAKLALAANRLDLAEKFARSMLKFSGWWRMLELSDTSALVHGGWTWLVSAVQDLSVLSAAHAATPPAARAGIEQPAYSSLRSATMSQALMKARAALAKKGLTNTVQLLGVNRGQSGNLAGNKMADGPARSRRRSRNGLAEPTKTARTGLSDAGSPRADSPKEDQSDPLAPIISRALARYGTMPPVSRQTLVKATYQHVQERLDEALLAARANPSLAGAVPIAPNIRTTTVITQPPTPVTIALITAPSLKARRLGQIGSLNAEAPLVGVTPDYESASNSADAQLGAIASTDPNLIYSTNFNQLLDTLAELTPEDDLDLGSFSTAEYETTRLSNSRVPKSRPQLRFDEESYLLGYQVFLARGNLEDAYAVAFSAARQAPSNLTWRERLAKVSEWSQRPIVALDNWLLLARANNSREYWHNVKRLAAGLRDEHRTIEFLHWKLARAPGDHQAAIQISQAHERLGEADKSISWLSTYVEQVPESARIASLMELAGVAERSGNADLLIDTLQRANRIDGATPARAVRIASTQYRRSRIRDAFEALREAEAYANDLTRHDAAAEKSTEYWKTYAELARLLRKDEHALIAYRQMLTLSTYEVKDLVVLSSLLQPRSQISAGQVLTHAYYKGKKPEHARRAINLLLLGHDLKTANSFMATLPDDLRIEISTSVEFLKQRAAYYQAADQLALARKDLLKIYKTVPNDIDNRAALVWLFLAEKNARGLRAVLRQWEKLAEKEPRLWGPFGAALLSLGQAPQSLKYFVRQSRERDDYLWWLAYADALDATGRTDAAWSLRRRAWTQLRNTPLEKQRENVESRDRIVALAMRFGPADEARKLLNSLIQDRQTLKQPVKVPRAQGITPAVAASAGAAKALATLVNLSLSDLRNDPDQNNPIFAAARAVQIRGLKSTANELAVSYLLSHESVDSARAWLLSRYAQQLTQPAWARLSVALATHDNQALDELLNTLSDWLPKLDKVEALTRLGRTAKAETLAFDTFTRQPDNQRAHKRLVDLFMGSGPSAGIGLTTRSQGVIDLHSIRADGAIRIDQHAKAWLFSEQLNANSTDNSIINNAQVKGKSFGVGIKWKRNIGELSAELTQREMLASTTGLKLRWQQNLNPIMNVAVSTGLNQASGELAALTIGGQEDYLQAETRINLTGRDYLAAVINVGQLKTQLDTKLSQRRRVSLEYGHRLKTQYPDLTVRTSLTNAVFTRRDASDPIIDRLAPLGSETPLSTFIPASSTQLDLSVSAGMLADFGHTRALRPFAEAGTSYNNKSGWGYSMRGGVGTSIIGADKLLLYAAYTGRSPGNARGTRELGLSWRLHY